MVMLMVLAIPAQRQVANAQIIILEGDESNSERNTAQGTSAVVPIPPQGWGDDWFPDDFAPLGDGVFLLAGLGASYLLGRRMRDKRRKGEKD